jgi:pimeloyl-ACP methyl ester carboxylesterase
VSSSKDGVRRRFPQGYHDQLHPDPNLNYQMNRFLGGEPAAGLAALGRRIGTLADWKREMLAVATAAEAAGERERAANYHRAAEFFISPGDPDKERAYDRFISLFNQVHAADRLERLTVPYEGHTLPVIRLRREDARGTVVVHAGFDAFIEEFWAGGAFLRDQGFDVVLFDGPGQGQPLVKQHLPMTHEWERPVGAVLDHLGLSGVTLIGVSLGGYLAPRAAAFEPRIARVVAFDVMYDFFDCVTSHAGPVLRAARPLLGLRATAALVNAALQRMMKRDLAVEWGVRQGMYVTGTRTPAEFLKALRSYTLAEVSSRITQDFLLLAGAEDHHVPLEQFFTQARALTNVRSFTGRIFTRQEQGQSHCQYGNLDLAFSVIADWIRERSAETGARH